MISFVYNICSQFLCQYQFFQQYTEERIYAKIHSIYSHAHTYRRTDLLTYPNVFCTSFIEGSFPVFNFFKISVNLIISMKNLREISCLIKVIFKPNIPSTTRNTFNDFRKTNLVLQFRTHHLNLKRHQMPWLQPTL